LTVENLTAGENKEAYNLLHKTIRGIIERSQRLIGITRRGGKISKYYLNTLGEKRVAESRHLWESPKIKSIPKKSQLTLPSLNTNTNNVLDIEEVKDIKLLLKVAKLLKELNLD